MFEQHVQQHLSERRRQRGPGTPARPRSAPAAMRAAPIRSDPRPPGPLPPASHARRCDPGPMRADSAPQAPRSPSCRQRRPELRVPHRKPALSETRPPARSQSAAAPPLPPTNQRRLPPEGRPQPMSERQTRIRPPLLSRPIRDAHCSYRPPLPAPSQWERPQRFPRVPLGSLHARALLPPPFPPCRTWPEPRHLPPPSSPPPRHPNRGAAERRRGAAWLHEALLGGRGTGGFLRRGGHAMLRGGPTPRSAAGVGPAAPG